MTFQRRIRPYFCLLITVSTAMGAVAPAPACGCASPGRAAPAGPNGTKTEPQARPPAPAPKACCQGGKRSCCPAAPRETAKSSCGCNDRASPAPTSSEPIGCECLQCACSTPADPSAPAPSPPSTDGNELLVLGSSVPPVLAPLPHSTGAPATDSRLGPPSADL